MPKVLLAALCLNVSYSVTKGFLEAVAVKKKKRQETACRGGKNKTGLCVSVQGEA